MGEVVYIRPSVIGSSDAWGSRGWNLYMPHEDLIPAEVNAIYRQWLSGLIVSDLSLWLGRSEYEALSQATTMLCALRESAIRENGNPVDLKAEERCLFEALQTVGAYDNVTVLPWPSKCRSHCWLHVGGHVIYSSWVATDCN
jgi:hypothetical protein